MAEFVIFSSSLGLANHCHGFQGTPTKPSYPRTLAGLNVTSIRDLTLGYDTTNPPTYKPSLPLSSGHMIQFRAESPEDGTKITLTTR
jgi:hypothetical protein